MISIGTDECHSMDIRKQFLRVSSRNCTLVIGLQVLLPTEPPHQPILVLHNLLAVGQ